jgi:hypothetical protein
MAFHLLSQLSSVAPWLGRQPPPHETIPRLPFRPTPARERLMKSEGFVLDPGVKCHPLYVMAQHNLHGQLGLYS